MSRRIDKLTPDTQEKLSAAIADMKSNGIKFFIDSTLRTTEEQQALYAQGRQPLEIVNEKRKIAGLTPIVERENKYTVTNCDGIKIKSRHQSGKAVDIVPIDTRGNPYWPSIFSSAWMLISTCMKKQGFAWGGNWTKEKDDIEPDLPHYQNDNGV
jgi:peptidoglycan L-alanyl-D-glutamate endopeptidase CwlK